MRKAALVSIFILVCLFSCPVAARAQEPPGFGGKWSFGFSSSYSPDSSHILIGNAEQRRVWTLGAEYTRLLYQSPRFRFDYEGSVTPLYEETDPTVTGTIYTLKGQSISTVQAPQRITFAVRGPVGYIVAGTSSTPIYALTGREDTYAGAVSPLGARVSAFPQRRIQPTFGLNLGFVLSAQDIPISLTDQFNYMFSFGPGVQLFVDHRTSWRFEYIYRHTSNAGQGTFNPGVDQGVARVTVSFHN